MSQMIHQIRAVFRDYCVMQGVTPEYAWAEMWLGVGLMLALFALWFLPIEGAIS